MRTSAYKAFFLSLLLFFALAASVGAADNGAHPQTKAQMFAFDFSQIGDAGLLMNITGKVLPLPQVVHTGNITTVTLPGTSWDKSGQEHRTSTVPMITQVSSQQVGLDAVITFTTELPVQLQTIRGAAPSDSYSLRLVTAQQHQALKEEPIRTKQPQTPRVPTGPFAVKTPITLDLRDTELKDVFRMLGTHLNKNIIIDPSLPPAMVTLTLKNVPLSEAFSYLMKTYDIAYEMIGKDTILVGTISGLAKVAGKEETRAYQIAYADPAAMQALVVNLTKIEADRLVVDPRQRTLYATSHPSKLEEIAIVLQRLDHPGRQVMLQARILEFSDNATRDVEAAVNAVYDHWWFNYSGTGGVKGGFVDDNKQGRDWTEPTGGILPTTTTLTTPMQGTWRMFDAAMRAVETKGRGKTLASPSVITVDGKKASISLTEDYPYISGRDDGGNPTWSFTTVGPQLNLTPIIGRNDTITIDLNVETGEVIELMTGSTGERMPRTSKRSVTTNVRVKDGEPFVIGGLFNENDSTSTTRIPVLGQIPLLGEIFTYRTKNYKKSQVVIVVIPHILYTPDVGIEQDRVMMRP